VKGEGNKVCFREIIITGELSGQPGAVGCRGPEIIAATRSAKIALSGKEGDKTGWI
jgi:hypothetical protein